MDWRGTLKVIFKGISVTKASSCLSRNSLSLNSLSSLLSCVLTASKFFLLSLISI